MTRLWRGCKRLWTFSNKLRIAILNLLFFAILFALRMLNVAKARARRSAGKGTPKAVEAMVKCSRCGVFLPRPEARITADGIRCNDPKCSVAREG